MSKVLVDRELLANLVSLWEMKGYGKEGSPGHCHATPGIWDQGNGTLAGKPCAECAIYDAARTILAQPAEAEGVEVVAEVSLLNKQPVGVPMLREGGGWTLQAGEKLVRQSDHLAALSAVTAERDRLRKDRDDCLAAREHYAGKFGEAIAERDQLRAENDRLRAGVVGDFDLDAWLDWTKEAERLRAEVEALRKALEQFADDGNWRYDTCSVSRDVAKAALAAKGAR